MGDKPHKLNLFSVLKKSAKLIWELYSWLYQSDKGMTNKFGVLLYKYCRFHVDVFFTFYEQGLKWEHTKYAIFGAFESTNCIQLALMLKCSKMHQGKHFIKLKNESNILTGTCSLTVGNMKNELS